MTVTIVCIVEGHGETSALPVFLRKIGLELRPDVVLHVPHPIRVSRATLLKDGQLERAIQLAAAQLTGDGAILVLLDADDDCPAKLAPQLLSRARSTRPDHRIGVVLALREYEAWLIASSVALNIDDDVTISGFDQESLRGAKEWLRQRLPGQRYSETIDQARLSAQIDLSQARRAKSFDKLYRELSAVLNSFPASD